MGQRNRKLKNRFFRTSKLESGSIPASICLVAEAWQRLHGVEPRRASERMQARHATTEEAVAAETETDVRQAFLEYRYRAAAPGGSLLIRPITEKQMHDTTELLTQSFSEAMGYMSVYRTFLRRHIQQYLQQHALLPPKTIVLVALLSPSGQATICLDGHESSNGAAKRLNRTGAAQSLSAAEMAAERERASVHTNIEELMQRLTAARLPGADANSSKLGEGTAEYDDGQAGSSAEASSSNAAEEGVLVGTVEVSVAASTRTRFLTLNAPEECAYVCNMAVSPEYRRRGYGLLLLEAAEEIARLGGQRDLYLHLRFQDKPAQALYQRAGYSVCKQDNLLVVLLGQDRRYLMHKRLTPGLTPGSA
ncbi:hypothetical protein WJX75_001880 [Coccomyxa subellipsoidea]|uniref:N-acetyltransferase domain-containing protein n=1 Tax=Coccomyxa subellipsoidea TaxID=248742 RepID=A0ABR2YK03_9CHLO